MINISKLKAKMQEVVCPQMPELCALISSQAWCLSKLDQLALDINSLLSQISQSELLDIAEKIVDYKDKDMAQILVYLISNVSAICDLMEGTQLDPLIEAKRDLLKAKIVQEMPYKESIVKHGCESLLLELKAYLETLDPISPEDQKILDQINAKLP